MCQKPKKTYHVYILRCSDKSLYTGYTLDIEARIKKHNDGMASKCTRARRPVKLVYSEEFKDRSTAMKREAEIKGLSRREKEGLIARA